MPCDTHKNNINHIPGSKVKCVKSFLYLKYQQINARTMSFKWVAVQTKPSSIKRNSTNLPPVTTHSISHSRSHSCRYCNTDPERLCVYRTMRTKKSRRRNLIYFYTKQQFKQHTTVLHRTRTGSPPCVWILPFIHCKHVSLRFNRPHSLEIGWHRRPNLFPK